MPLGRLFRGHAWSAGRWAWVALTAVVICVASGCATTPEPELLRAEARVPIREQMVSPGFQKRIVPWDALVLEANAPIEPVDDEELTPGVREAVARLEAREAALEDLVVRLGQLPAAEPLPGENARPSVSDFAKRHPAVEEVITAAFESGWTEEVRRDRQGRAVLVLRLPLEGIAEVILMRGGGFSPESEIGRTLSARSLAQKKALEEAQKNLAGKLADSTLFGNSNVRNWVADPMVNESVVSAVRSARVLRSEQTTTEGGQEVWLMELELDPEPTLQQVRERVQELEEENSEKESE